MSFQIVNSRLTMKPIIIALLAGCLILDTGGCGYLAKTKTKPTEVNFTDSSSLFLIHPIPLTVKMSC
jgi:hypothetical protein